MVNQGNNNLRLGIFVIAGLLVLVVSFYMIGKNRHLFGTSFTIRARFSNLNGLMEGNNVLYSGIQAGTVKSITLLNDTTIEVAMLIDKKVISYIRKNAVASIGTEGLMGNKVVNIAPRLSHSSSVADGDLLAAQEPINTDEMLQTLSHTNQNMAYISNALKTTINRINQSGLMRLLDDPATGYNLKTTLKNVRQASAQADEMATGLNKLVSGVRKGKGAAGLLLADTTAAADIRQALTALRVAGTNAQQLTSVLNNLAADINQDMNNGQGTLHLLLKDSVSAQKIRSSLDHVEQGTNGFNQSMEALKHNFLLRGYFKDQEKQKAKDQKKQKAAAH